jgi:hypothetical protein
VDRRAGLDDLAATVEAGEGPRKARPLLHAAKTGLVPADHIEVHEQLGALLQPRGQEPIPPCRRVGKRV